MSLNLDKSQLSKELQEKQKYKGTYDSPCMSVCDYVGEQLQCQTCGMQKSEKQRWKVAGKNEKTSILQTIENRILNMT